MFVKPPTLRPSLYKSRAQKMHGNAKLWFDERNIKMLSCVYVEWERLRFFNIADSYVIDQ